MTDRFHALTRYSVAAGADAILFTCSAFGPCIEAAAADLDLLPVLKPNEALIEECAAHGGGGGEGRIACDLQANTRYDAA